MSAAQRQLVSSATKERKVGLCRADRPVELGNQCGKCARCRPLRKGCSSEAQQGGLTGASELPLSV